MKLSIETIESTNFGDHGERLRKSHVVVEGESVEDLVARVFTKLNKQYYQHDVTDEIVIRVMDPGTAPTDAAAVDPGPVAPAAAAGPGESF